MKKIVSLLVVLLLLPAAAEAHSSLSSSLPAEGEVVAEPLQEIQLTFDTPIEESSTMTLSGEGQAIDFAEIAVSEDTMIGTLEEELPNGAYTVEWQIVSQDGHPVQGTVPFEVEAGDTAEENAAEQGAEEPAGEQAEEAEENVTEENGAETLEEGEGSPLLTIIIAIAVFALLAGLYFTLRKK